MFKELSLNLFQNSDLITLVIIISLLFIILKMIFKYFKINNFTITFITITYFILSIFNLGSFSLPTSNFNIMVDNGYIVLEADNPFREIYTISGEGDNNANGNNYQIYYRGLELSVSNDDINYEKIKVLEQDDFYKYELTTLTNEYKYIKLEFKNPNSVLTEIYAANNQIQNNLRIKRLSDNISIYDANKIIDEQETFVSDASFYDETYFDEIYHVRNAYEIANNQKMYTAVHPLLGTEIIALGIKIFGMNPFGFRIMGVIFSSLMLPLIYLIIKEITNNKFALYGSVLMFGEFMHYTTGRIGTLEPFSIFFIMAMFYFMIKAIKINYVTNLKKHLTYLFLSGLFMSFAISTKWTGCYGAVGLAIIYFIFNIKCFISEKDNPKRNLNTIELLLFSILFFVIIPIIIYVSSFIFVPMYFDCPNNFKEFIDQVIEYNTYMATYHFGLDSTHPYSSKWYMWLFNIRPIWYYVKRMTNSIMTITCMNNPLINLSGILAIIYGFYQIFKNKSKPFMVMIIMYLSLLLPWIFVERTTFAYHYYPCIPFLIMIITYALYDIYHKLEYRDQRIFKKAIKIYLIAVIILFIMFLPVIGGFETSYFYVQKFLRWLPSWYFG